MSGDGRLIGRVGRLVDRASTSDDGRLRAKVGQASSMFKCLGGRNLTSLTLVPK